MHGEQADDAGRDLLARAEAAAAAGDIAAAIAGLERAVVVLAAVPDPSASVVRARGECSRRLAQLLTASGRVPEAMQAYQEAADAFGAVPGSDEDARWCARQAAVGVRALFARPAERLDLLIARYDRELRQLAVREGAEERRADTLFRLGTILQRRDRFPEAARRYADALALFGVVVESELRQAACHFRLAGLFHHELTDPHAARRHYVEAIRLFAASEPVVECEQPNRVLCEMLLRGLDAGLT